MSNNMSHLKCVKCEKMNLARRFLFIDSFIHSFCVVIQSFYSSDSSTTYTPNKWFDDGNKDIRMMEIG